MQISDQIYIGPVFAGGGQPDGVSIGPSPMSTGVGPLGQVYCYDIVPLTLQAAGLAVSANPGSGASFTLAAGTGVTAVVDATGTTRYVLDVPRCVTVTAAGANSATYLVTGYDVYGQRMTANLAAPSTSTTATTKAFKSIISVTNANTTATTNGVTVGFNDKFGLPIRVTNAVFIINVKWNSTLAADAGTFVAADTTSPATAATTDVRGCYTPSAGASDGVKRLVVAVYVPGVACGPNATRVGAYGVTQV